MKITHCKLNHLVNPLGYTLPQLSFSWQVEDAHGTKQTAARLIIAADTQLTEICTIPALPIWIHSVQKPIWKLPRAPAITGP